MTIATPVLIYLATHPGVELTSYDIAEAWFTARDSIHKTLKYAESKGWVTITMRPNPRYPKRKQICYYSAGPRLLKEMQREKFSFT
jgi:hypothetical protein